MPLSWLFLYGIFVIRAYYMFLRYKPTFLCYGHRVRFFCNNDGKSIQQFHINKKGLIFFSKTESCFCVIFKSYPSLLKSPEFLTPGVLRYAYNTTALKTPSSADYLATPFSPLLNFSALALSCFYLKSNILAASFFISIKIMIKVLSVSAVQTTTSFWATKYPMWKTSMCQITLGYVIFMYLLLLSW